MITSKKNKILTRIGCFLIGWNSEILSQCGEASYKAFRRYISAVTILMIIWGVIGYSFAEQYIEIQGFIGKIVVALSFMTIILCVERFIILQVGKSELIKWFRIVLALLMASLGATVFDQIIFKNDIAVKMKEIRTDQINKEVPKRISFLNEDIKRVTTIIDSVGQSTVALYAQLHTNPVIQTTDVSTVTKQIGVDDAGNPIMVKTTNVETKSRENPINGQVKANEAVLKMYQDQLNQLQGNKMSVAEDVRREYEAASVGFLQELKAIFSIIGNSVIALVFYIILFLFLLSLELLVLFSKSNDVESDYDLIVVHQLNIKRKMLDEIKKTL